VPGVRSLASEYRASYTSERYVPDRAARRDVATVGLRSANGDPTIKLLIKVVPGSSRDCIVGWLGETLKVRVRAPAERGQANAAVEEILAGALGVPKECARIVAGRTSARKVVEISGLSETEIRHRLSQGAT